jgi:hypothetical protein
MADKTKPVMPPGAENGTPEYIEPPPNAVPDIRMQAMYSHSIAAR